jgi:NADPH:quinone reductase-like Zn-dependent oxidoreductase
MDFSCSSSRGIVLNIGNKELMGILRGKKIVVENFGDSSTLSIKEETVPEPLPDQVRVKVLASGVAFADLMMREGLYPGGPNPPFTPGYDIVGIIESVGADCKKFALGTRVAALTVFGGYSNYICIKENECFEVPQEKDLEKLVALVLNYVTAYQMLHRVTRVEKGNRILVHNAAGGVGTALLELGHLAGASVIGTASREKHDIVSSLRAIPIEYHEQSFVEYVNNIYSEGMDIVFDAMGGLNLMHSFEVLRSNGTLVYYGVKSLFKPGTGKQIAGVLLNGLIFLRLKLFPQSKKTRIYFITKTKQNHPDWFRQDFKKIIDLYNNDRIDPIVETLSLENIQTAHERLQSRKVRGKLVLLHD